MDLQYSQFFVGKASRAELEGEITEATPELAVSSVVIWAASPPPREQQREAGHDV